MKKYLFVFMAALPFVASAQVDCVDAKDCYTRGVQSLFDKEKIDYQNECFTKAVKFDPNYAAAYHYRGGNYARQEKYNEAIADYTKFIDLAKKEEKPSKFVLAKVYFYRGESYAKLGKKKQALADYKAASETFPKEEKYLNAYNELNKK
jgi:tetratricopeptide (TPR) repeat protein